MLQLRTETTQQVGLMTVRGGVRAVADPDADYEANADANVDARFAF